MSPFSTLKLELIQKAEELQSLEGEWSQLWDEDSMATPFQSPEWLLPWWRNFKEGELFVIALRQNGRLCALLPFYIYSDPAKGERQLLFLGAGTSDYLDGLFSNRRMAPTEQDALVSIVTECLLNYRQLWDIAYLKQLRNDSPILALTDLFPSANRRYPSEACAWLSLERDKNIPSKILRNIHYYRRHAEQMGRLEFTPVTLETALSTFDELVSLHRQRWERLGQDGVLAEERVRQHHRETIPLLYRKQILRLSRLTIDGNTIGVFYGLADSPSRRRRKVYYYLSGFHPDYHMVSPGTLLLAAAVEEGKAEGAIGIDLLRGEEQYKRLWGAEFYPTYAIELRSLGRSPHMKPAQNYPLRASA